MNIQLALGVAALAATLMSGAGLWARSAGKDAGRAEVRAEWEAARAAERAEVQRVSLQAQAQATALEGKLRETERRHAKTSAQLRAALDAPSEGVVCPPVGGRVGDVVLPAAVIDGMFNRDTSSPAAPESAASGAHAAVR